MGEVTINVAIELEGDADAADRASSLVISMPNIFQAVIVERAAQDRQWGGPAHDDGHTPAVWANVLCDHVMRLSAAQDTDYRQRLIKIIAIGVAAVQSFDRLSAPGEAGEVIQAGEG